MVAENIKPFYEAEAQARRELNNTNRELIPYSEAGRSRDKVASKFHVSGKYVDMAGKDFQDLPDIHPKELIPEGRGSITGHLKKSE